MKVFSRLFKKRDNKKNTRFSVEDNYVKVPSEQDMVLNNIMPEVASLDFLDLSLSDTQVLYILSKHLDSFVRGHRSLKDNSVAELRVQFVFRSDGEINELKKALLLAIENYKSKNKG